MLLKMVDDTYANNNMNMRGNTNEQYPEVPEEAIIKPEDERPARTIKRPKKNCQETKVNLTTLMKVEKTAWIWMEMVVQIGPSCKSGHLI